MGQRINSKLFFSIGFATIFIFGVLSYLFLNQQKSEHTDKIYREANIFSEIITRAVRFNMPIGNRECIYRMMKVIGAQNGIEIVRMFDKKGKIKFSTNKQEVGTYVDMKAEACNTCHAQEKPMEILPQKFRYRIFRPKNHRVLAIITPIYNGPTCYNGACHVHSKEESILGVLDVGLSLAAVDNESKEIQLIFILFTIIAIICFSSILAFFIHRLVTKPVKQLAQATQNIAQGNLDVEIPIKTKDEIGQLAMSFNQMVQDLKKANEKLQSWSSELEKKVEERTEKLRLAREQLIQSEKMASMGVLSSSVAHEINNPLQGILTYIKLMLKILSGEEIDQKRLDQFKNYLQLMGNEIERCGDMVKNLLVFSKQTKLNIQEANINNIINNSLQLVDNKIKLQNIEVMLNFQEDIPLIYCDIKQIQQTLIALIINSLEAMAGEGKLRIETQVLEDRQVEILIADTGQGISKENLKKIFDPFFTTKESSKSTGLGLFVAYGIIKEHKGTIKVESELGKGTRFHIKLPSKAGE
jgi:two-component system NtrC family sensor kinase